MDLNRHGLVAIDEEIVDLALGVADGSTSMAESATFLRHRLFDKELPAEHLRWWFEDLDASLREAGSLETLGAGIRRHRRISSAIVNAVLMSEEWTALFPEDE